MSTIHVFAGPNGSGKSTITKELPIVGKYVNADEIQRHLGCSPLEAAQNAEAVREYCLAHEMDFTMETVLSTSRNLDLLRRAKDRGYYVVCFFVLTHNPDINVQRIADRVAAGGHDVPTEKVCSRYIRSVNNLQYLQVVADELYVFDNSSSREAGEAALIVKSCCGIPEFYPSPYWSTEMLLALMSGSYPQEFLNLSS